MGGLGYAPCGVAVVTHVAAFRWELSWGWNLQDGLSSHRVPHHSVFYRRLFTTWQPAFKGGFPEDKPRSASTYLASAALCVPVFHWATQLSWPISGSVWRVYPRACIPRFVVHWRTPVYHKGTSLLRIKPFSEASPLISIEAAGRYLTQQ